MKQLKLNETVYFVTPTTIEKCIVYAIHTTLAKNRGHYVIQLSRGFNREIAFHKVDDYLALNYEDAVILQKQSLNNKNKRSSKR